MFISFIVLKATTAILKLRPPKQVSTFFDLICMILKQKLVQVCAFTTKTNSMEISLCMVLVLNHNIEIFSAAAPDLQKQALNYTPR